MPEPSALNPLDRTTFRPDKMAKVTLFESERMLVGLNCFEPGQEHHVHVHEGLDKAYYVLRGQGLFLLEDGNVAASEGTLLVVPAGVPHGVRNSGPTRLVVLVFLAPAPR
jgi:quercetin dioxygenase-like cupin family protein